MLTEDVRSLIKEVLQEVSGSDAFRNDTQQKNELLEEKRRREELEQRVNQLVEENRRSQELAERAERESTIRTELQRLGVAKVDLAFKAVKDDLGRNKEGRIVAASEQGEVDAREYLTRFVAENPELLPARISGGSGSGPNHRLAEGSVAVGIDQIRPGMSAEELERVREEISRVALSAIRGDKKRS